MFAENLKYLRQKHEVSQGQLSEYTNIPRTTLGDYERGKTDPSIMNLLKVSNHFKIPVDDILKRKLGDDLSVISSSKQLKVLAVSLDHMNNQNIELVNTRAEAGYLESYSDPEYIRELPKINIPGLQDKTYRGFTIQGDSMLPMESGSIIISSYVEQLKQVKNDRTYIIISKRDGLVYKRVRNNFKEKSLTLISDNAAYVPYSISYDEIDEIWAYKAHVSFSDSKLLMEEMLEEKLTDIQRKVNEIHAKI